MIVKTILSYAALASACTPRYGFWKVQDGDVTNQAARSLYCQTRDIRKLNEGMEPGNINPGEIYTVPYIASPLPPAQWSTEVVETKSITTCKVYLELRSPTTDTSAIIAEDTGTTTAPSAVDTAAASHRDTGATTALSAVDTAAASHRDIGTTSAPSAVDTAATSHGDAGTTTAPSAVDTAPSAVDTAPSAVDTAPSAMDTAVTSHEDAGTTTAPSAMDTAAASHENSIDTINSLPESSGVGTTRDLRTIGTTTLSAGTETQHFKYSLTLSKPPDTTFTSTKESPSPNSRKVSTFSNETRYCNPRGSIWGGTSELNLNTTAKTFCNLKRSPLQEKNRVFASSIYVDGPKFTRYTFSLTWNTWDPRCKSREEVIDSKLCSDTMFENYRKCINGGKGGSVEKTCITYAYQPSVDAKAAT